MDAAPSEKSQRLTQNLGDLKSLYETMMVLLREEHHLLILANLEELKQNNSRKEETLRKIQLTDQVRQKLAAELGAKLGLVNKAPRLLELAPLLPAEEKKTILLLYGDLQKLIRETTQLNRDNSLLAEGALSALSGAMNDIKETVSGKPTYGDRGKYKLGPEVTGHFVRKEA